MPKSPPIPSANELHEQVESLRGFAQALVGPTEADDLLSSTYVKALERPPKSKKRLKAWLATVMRNIAIDQGRANRSRSVREDRVCQPQRRLEPTEIVEGAEAKRILLKTLRELDRASQELLVLRYFERRSPGEIAELLEISVAATRVRLTRSLGAMRRLMRAKYGLDWKGYCIVATGGQVGLTGKGAFANAGGKWSFHGNQLFNIAVFGALILGLGALIWPLFFGGVETPIEADGSLLAAQLDKPTDSITKGKPERFVIDGDLGLGTVFVMDHTGSPVPDAVVNLLGDVNQWHGKAISATPGLFKIGPKGGLIEKDRDLMLLVTSNGHAPYLEKVEAIGSHITIRLPRKYVVSGFVDLSEAQKSTNHYLRLSLEAMQPGNNSAEFEFRSKLGRRQRQTFDQAFHSFAAYIQSDGTFEFDGLDSDWQGGLAYLGQFHSLEGSMLWNGRQVFWVHGPRNDIWLELTEMQYAKGWIAWPAETDRVEKARVSSLFSEIHEFEANQVHFDEATGAYRVYSDEFPEGELTANISLATGRITRPIHWVGSEKEEFRVEIGDGFQKRLFFIDKSGIPIEGVKVTNSMAKVLAISDDHGVATVRTYGETVDLQVDDPRWLKVLISDGLAEETMTLLPRTGITFEMPELENLVQFDLLSNKGFRMRFRCLQGLSSLGEDEGRRIFEDQNWYRMEFDPASGQLMEFYTPVGSRFPAHVVDLGIGGDVECTLFDGDIPLWMQVIPLEEWNQNKTIHLKVPPREERLADFQVLNSQGKPMRYASVSLVKGKRLENVLGELDGYGMGISAAYDIEAPIVFSKRGYHPSPITSIKNLIDDEGGVITMASARQIIGSASSFAEFLDTEDLYCAGIRFSDGLVFERFRVDGSFKMFNCPIDPFWVEFSTDAWEYQLTCEETRDSLEILLPQKVILRISLSQSMGISLKNISRIEFLGSNGKWTAKTLGRIAGDDRSFDLSIPGFRDLGLIQVHLMSGEVIEFPPSIYEDGEIWRLSL